MDEQQLTDALAAEQAKRDAVKAEREAQLRMMLENRSALVDTTPTADLFDSLYGGQNVKGALAVQGAAKEQDDELNKLLEEGRKPESGSGLDAVKMAYQSQKQEKAEAYKGNRMGEKEGYNVEKEMQIDYTRSVLGPIKELDIQFSTIDSALATEDIQTIGMILGQFARGISGEKGVLTDEDIARVFPRTVLMDVSKVQAYFTGKAKADPETLDKARRLVSYARENASKNYREIIANKRKQYSARSAVKENGLDLPGGVISANEESALTSLNRFAPIVAGQAGKGKEAAPKGAVSSKVQAILNSMEND